MLVGVTGHQELNPPASWEAVGLRIVTALSSLEAPLVGYSSLAPGTDQRFADLVLQAGGELYAVIPFERYETRLRQREDIRRFEHLRRSAYHVEVLPRVGSDEECYLRAGKRIVDSVQVMIAVWNGKPAAGIGGTGDIVAYANAVGRTIIHIDPYRG